MRILLVEKPSENGYIESLINAYKELGHEVYCGVYNFYHSNVIPDIIHIHWPESLYKWNQVSTIDNKDSYELIKERLEWYKNNPTKIIHTIHNKKPHDGSNSKDIKIFNLILSSADIVVHHCKSSFNNYSNELLKNKNNIICPHGDYLIHYKKIDKKIARKRYNISNDKIVTLNFGAQKRYKNELIISESFNQVKNESRFLLVAGRFDYINNSSIADWFYKIRNKIRKHFYHSKRKYIYNQIPLEELPYIMACSDIAFLGQKEALNSGFISLAATYSIPLVIPDTGCFKESANNWSYITYEAGNIKDASNKLNEMYNEIEKHSSKSNKKWLTEHSWIAHAEKIINEIKKL